MAKIEPLYGPLAERQYGLLAADQLRSLGSSDEQIQQRCRDGRLVRVHPRVFRVAGAPGSYEQDLMAAVLAGGRSAVVSHRSACVLWGIDAPGVGGHRGPTPVEVTVQNRRRPRLTGVIVHRSLDLVPQQLDERAGLPVTNPLRLLVDLGAVAPDFRVDRALEQLLIKHLVTVNDVRAMLGHLSKRGRRGCGVLRRVLENRALGDAIPDGMLEPVFANLCRDRNLPQPTFQYEMVIAGERRRLDFAYVEAKLAIEVDGWETHGERQAFRRDRATDAELAARGWQVLRFTWDDVVYRPGWVARILRENLRQRGAA